MKQLLLELNTQIPQTLDSFVIGQNFELLSRMHEIAKRGDHKINDRMIYLWGESGAGKTHLLHALSLYSGARLINPNSRQSEFEYDRSVDVYLLDDCQHFNEEQQIAAFNLYNQVKEHAAFWVATGTLPPTQLKLRDDFRTRLGWGLIYHVQGLSDQEKIAALDGVARSRGVLLPEPVLSYLITHFQRDMPSLTGLIHALINHSLELKRPMTMPFVREIIQQQKETNE